MAITLPTPGQTNWDVPLNDALFELQQDITDGANTFVTRVNADVLYARNNDARITNALSQVNNLSELDNIGQARSNLGLGNSATRDVGTTSSTVAQGDAVPLHVAATDPHGDRAYADQNFLSAVTGGIVNGAVTLSTGTLTLQAGGLNVNNGTTTLNGNVNVTGSVIQNGGNFGSYGANSGSRSYIAAVGGDASDRWHVLASGYMGWSDGTGGEDTNLFRSAANVLATNDDFAIKTAGKGLKVQEGSNAKMGTAVLAGGTVVVTNTSVTANSRIFLTNNAPGGTPGWLRVSARTAGTSFTILSSSNTDTSTIAWMIVEPA